MNLKKILAGGGLGLAMLGMGACATITPAQLVPNINLSKANLTAQCTATNTNPASVWAACTALSQATFVCDDLASGTPIDLQIVSLVNAFAPDSVLEYVVGANVAAENMAMTDWCITQGYIATTATK